MNGQHAIHGLSRVGAIATAIVVCAIAASSPHVEIDAFAQSTGAVPAGLAPIQLTPDRRQLIGVKIATVQRREVSETLETTGSIEPDERLQGYVQTRFPGWIEKVFANQTYQFVRKGSPLFTIYSPDLVSTENEYLLALKNKTRVQSSSVEGVGEGDIRIAPSYA